MLKLVKVTSKDPCFFLIIIKGSHFQLLLMLLFVSGNLLFLVLRLFFIAELKGLIRNIKNSPRLYPLWHQGSHKKLPLHFCNIRGYFHCTVGLSTLNMELVCDFHCSAWSSMSDPCHPYPDLIV